MPRTIILNSTHYIEGSQNLYVYNLPQSVKFTNKSKIGVSSVSVYNSTFNVSARRLNNTVTLIWNANTSTSYTWTIPDGYYSASDLNSFLQSKMFENKLYCNTTGNTIVYFFEITQNAVRYAIQLTATPLPTSANATTLSYTIPAGATWSFPTANNTPQLTFNNIFGNLLGFDGQTYPNAVQATTQSILSTKTPNISPVDSYILTCNLINSRYSIPSNVLYTIPLTGGLGTLITNVPSNVIMNDIAPNIYNQIVIQFFDQLFNQLQMNDHDIVITLVIDDSLEELR